MGHEKLPQDYDQGAIQKILERLKMSITGSELKRVKSLYDTSQELKQQIADLEKKLTEKISTLGDERAPTQVSLPVPQNLKAWEMGTWGWATVDPFMRWKYIGKIQGYEFYGSQNTGFTPQPDPYLQSGYHYGTGTVGSPDTYLKTEDSDTPANTHVLDTRLIQVTLDKQMYEGNDEGGIYYKLTLENTTQSTSGPIAAGAYRLLDRKYQIKATGVTWVEGDKWVIKNYPSNKLFNIGALSTFNKRAGNFYVVARSIGKGNAASVFTSEETSTGPTSSEDLSTPTIVQPIHSDGTTCPLNASGQPEYGEAGGAVVDWSDIVAGTRETDHLNWFGVEWCNVEIVYNTIDEDDGTVDIFYRVKRTGVTVGDDVDEETGLD